MWGACAIVGEPFSAPQNAGLLSCAVIFAITEMICLILSVINSVFLLRAFEKFHMVSKKYNKIL